MHKAAACLTLLVVLSVVVRASLVAHSDDSETLWWCPLPACHCPDSADPPPTTNMVQWMTQLVEKSVAADRQPLAFTPLTPVTGCNTTASFIVNRSVSASALAMAIAARIPCSATVVASYYGTHPAVSAFGEESPYQYGFDLAPPEGYLYDQYTVSDAAESDFGSPQLSVTAWVLALSWVWADGNRTRLDIVRRGAAAFTSTIRHLWANGIYKEIPLPGYNRMASISIALLAALNRSSVIQLPYSNELPTEPFCDFVRRKQEFPHAILVENNNTISPIWQLDPRTTVILLGYGWMDTCDVDDPCALLERYLAMYGVNRTSPESVWTSSYLSQSPEGHVDLELTVLLKMALESIIGEESRFDSSCRSNVTALRSNLAGGDSTLVCDLKSEPNAAGIMARSSFNTTCDGVWLSLGGTAASLAWAQGINVFNITPSERSSATRTINRNAATKTVEPTRTTSTRAPTTAVPETTNHSTTNPPSTQAPHTRTPPMPTTEAPEPSNHSTTHPPSTEAPNTHVPVSPTALPTHGPTTRPSDPTSDPSSLPPRGDSGLDSSTLTYAISGAAAGFLVIVVGGILVRARRRQRGSENERLLPASDHPTHNMGFF